MTYEIVIAGFGGQGVMLMGQLLTYAGMIEDKHVSWIPSYGPEMRGGTANCSVIISDEQIGNPIASEPTIVVAMNLPSLDKFEPLLKTNGTLLINSSLIEKKASRKDIQVYSIAANEIASDIGNPKVANMVVLGALIAATKIVKRESLLKAFAKLFEKKQISGLLEINETAIYRGAEGIAV